MEKGGSWTQHIGVAVEVYNTSWHDIVEAIPTELWEANSEAWEKGLKNQKFRRLQDKPGMISPQNFKIGQLVLIYDSVQASSRADKFGPLWKGPVRLIRQHFDRGWEYEELEVYEGPRRPGIRTVHVSHM